MKQYLIDFLLVCLLICVMSLFFGDHQVSQTYFERSIEEFEDHVESSQEVDHRYVTLYDLSNNKVSLFFKTISDGCLSLLKYIVLIFSDLISLLF